MTLMRLASVPEGGHRQRLGTTPTMFEGHSVVRGDVQRVDQTTVYDMNYKTGCTIACL